MKHAVPNSSAEAYSVGWSLSGPVFSAYVQWVCDVAEDLGLSSVLFLARDGQLLHKLLRQKEEVPFHTAYFPASRASWYPCLPQGLSFHMLYERIRNEYHTFEHTCEAFKLQASSIPLDLPSQVPLSNSNIHKLTVYLTSQEGRALLEQSSALQRQHLLQLLFNEGISLSTSFGIVDIGWGGSLQDVLEQVWQISGGTGTIHGFYFGLNRQISPTRHSFAYEPSLWPHWVQCYPSLVEMLTPADHGSVTGFTDTPQGPGVCYANNPVADPSHIQQLHQGALDWAAQHPPLPKIEALRLLRHSIDHPSPVAVSFFQQVKFESTLFALEGTPFIQKQPKQRLFLQFLKPSRGFVSWPWPQGTLTLSGLGFLRCGLTLRFQVQLCAKHLLHRIHRLFQMFTHTPTFYSFDVFDTVLYRQCGSPHQVFHSIAKDKQLPPFAQHRIETESQARQSSLSGEVTLAEIYQQLESTHPQYKGLNLLEVELAYEAQCLAASPRGLRHITRRRRQGHSICYISDMYLPSNWLQQQLEQHGLWAEGDQIFVSCEHACSKHHEGQLYQIVFDQVQPHNWHHYGDNLNSDVLNAAKRGIRPHWCPHSFSAVILQTFSRTVRKCLHTLTSPFRPSL